MAVELLQDAVVTVVAIGAGALVARRVFGFVAVRDKPRAGCDKCVTASSPQATQPGGRGEAPSYPVTLIRPSRKA
ncbi:MAG: hypothetical protein FJW27_12510 [Acidimicrobiia bacterium]|nr:hypothetical protein [Acidimicrobiia bacterium]